MIWKGFWSVMVVACGAIGVAHAQSASPAVGAIAATSRHEFAATVQAVDKTARTITMKADGAGEPVTLEVPPEVRNFDQIAVGDRVRANYLDAVVVAVRQPNTPAGASETNTITVAPVGAKPGAAAIRTREVTATITSIDTDQRLVTLRGAGGQSRTIHVDPHVDLSTVKVGDNVTARHTEATVLAVEKAP
jgi:hypothetical protein